MDDLAELIGRVAHIMVGEMAVTVTILDARQCYGRTDCLVRPVAGSGVQWVRMTSLTVKDK